MHKLKKKVGPDYLLEKLICHEDIHHYNTSKKSDFVVSKSRTVSNQNTFFSKVVKSYNNVTKLKNDKNQLIFSTNESVSTFKRKIKRHFLSCND